jgi:hypothetical protein
LRRQQVDEPLDLRGLHSRGRQHGVDRHPVDLECLEHHLDDPAIDQITADLTESSGSWSGTVLDVPPGTGRTVTAQAFDIDANDSCC